MLGALLLVWCAGADAAGGVYRVERQDFSSPSPVGRSLGYQNLLNGRPGVYKVNRQDFAGNAPFAQNGGPPFSNMHGYYPQQKVLYPYEQPQLGPSSVLPALFVPADQEQANYKDVLSLSEYNRRVGTPSYLQPSAQTLPSYLQPPAQSQTSAPPFQYPAQSFQHPAQSFQHPAPPFQRPAQSYTVPSYLHPALQPSTPSAVPSAVPSQPSKPYWMVTSASPRLSTTTATTIAPSFATYSPLAPAVNDDDGILAPIPVNDEENKPLPPVSAQESTRKVYVTEDAAGNRHTKVKYHSFDDFVEISDEHRELLESFGSIQNNESDFAELPEASPIRRRRNASHSQVFSVFSVREALPGAAVVRRDPEQLIGSYVNRLRQQIEILNDMKMAVRDAKLRQQGEGASRTIVAADDSTVVVFNGNANFDGKLEGNQDGKLEGDQDGKLEGNQDGKLVDDQDGKSVDDQDSKLEGNEDGKLEDNQDGKLEGNQDGKLGMDQDGKLESDPMSQPDTAEDLRSSMSSAESVGKDSTSSKDLVPASRESNPWLQSSTQPEVVDPTTTDGSHEVLFQKDEAADVRPTSDPRDQIIYLTEPFKMATRSVPESWEDENWDR